MKHDFTVGVEEEYLVLDAATRAPVPHGEMLVQRSRQVLGDAVTTELQRAQIEVGSRLRHPRRGA